jgi:hypothetical protein
MSSTKSSDVGHWLRIEGVVTALYGVPALQEIRRPSMPRKAAAAAIGDDTLCAIEHAITAHDG